MMNSRERENHDQYARSVTVEMVGSPISDLRTENERLRAELAEWKSAAGVAGLTVGVLKEENDRLKYATPVNPSDVTNT